MPKLFDSSGPVTLDRYSRFYSMEHRDLIAKESKEELVADVNRLTLETNDLIETLVYSKEGIDILINNEVLSEEALDNAKDLLGYDTTVSDLIRTEISHEGAMLFMRKVMVALKKVIQALINSVKRLITAIAKLFYNDKELEEKFKSIKEKTRGLKTTFKDLFSWDISQEDFNSTKYVSSREQMVYYSWPYIAVNNNLVTILQAMKTDISDADTTLMLVMKNYNRMFINVSDSLEFLKDKTSNNSNAKLEFINTQYDISTLLPGFNKNFKDLLRFDTTHYNVKTTSDVEFDERHHIPVYVSLKDYHKSDSDFHYADVKYTSLKTTITHGGDKVVSEVHEEVYIPKHKFYSALENALRHGIMYGGDIVDESLRFFMYAKDSGGKIKALDDATHDDLQNIVDIIDRYERDLGDKFASKENLKYLSNVRDVVVQFTKSLLSILYYRKDRLEKFNRVFRLVYKGLVEEIERSK